MFSICVGCLRSVLLTEGVSRREGEKQICLRMPDHVNVNVRIDCAISGSTFHGEEN